MAFLFALHELAVVLGAPIPLLDTIAILQVIYPCAPVGGEALLVVVMPETLRGVFLPLAHEHVPIRMQKLPKPFGEILCPIAYELRPIDPRLLSQTMPGVRLPLASVCGTSPEGVGWPWPN